MSDDNLNQDQDQNQENGQGQNIWTEEQLRVLEAAGLPTEAEPEEDRKPTRDAVAAAFREELKHANEPGAKVMSADRELRYCLELQQKRIANRSLRFTDEMVPGAYFQEGFNNVRSWQDGQYETSWSVGFVEHTKTFDRPNMKPYKKKEPQAIYETVVDVRSGEDVSDDTYCCPNCGSVSTIRELQEGCSHCGTAFKMSELYPKVTNYFFTYDTHGKRDSIKKTVIKYGLYSLPVMIPLMVGVAWYQRHTMPETYGSFTPMILIKYALGTILISPLIGYFMWMFSIFAAAGRQIGTGTGPALSVGRSRKKFEAKMSKIMPAYTFETFSSRITSLFKLIAFSDDRASLPFYEGGDIGSEFDNVVDCAFSGWMSCNKIKQEGKYVYVTGNLFVDVTRDLGDHIKSQREVYRIKAGRRTDVPTTSNFSIAKIQCRTCGASFNSFKTRNCPYCGSASEPASDDWVIYEVKNAGQTYMLKPLIIVLAILVLIMLGGLSTLGIIK
ncbi:MAG: hypothetical protein K6D93_04900 [Saccharofermentans sp.]|nr:hypothetical protein [Saccharofermentans sp.]